jgi:hypothetical protein
MYGPPLAQPPQPARPGTRALVVRGLFASFPVWSLGFLAPVPFLRFALLRRRPLDWAVFALYCALTFVEVVLIYRVPDDESTVSFLAGLFIVAYLAGAPVHACLGDRFPRPAAATATAGFPVPPHAHPPAAPYAVPHAAAHVTPPVAPHAPAAAPYAPSVAAPPPAPPSPVAPAAPGPSPRMRQVASELDELGEFLRREEGRP